MCLFKFTSAQAFCTLVEYFDIKWPESLPTANIVGAPIKQLSVNCQLSLNTNMSVPIVLNKFHKKLFKLFEMRPVTMPVSDERRDRRSPVLFLSKKRISCSMSARKTCRLILMFMWVTPIENTVDLIPANNWLFFKYSSKNNQNKGGKKLFIFYETALWH